MKRPMRIVGFLLIPACWAVGAGADSELKVTADRVNLRARPALESEVVCQASKGELLRSMELQGNWYRVVPPTNADFWAHTQFINNGVVTSKLNVRGGPGINYGSVGALAKGDTVTVRGKRGDWLQIAPPPGSGLWVSREFVVEVIPPPPVVATDAAKPVPETPATNAAPPAELVAKGLKARAEQGVATAWEGLLRPVDFFFNRPGEYRLVHSEKGGAYCTLCYVRGNNDQLKGLVGKRVQIRGREYWLNQTQFPVIVPETIATLP